MTAELDTRRSVRLDNGWTAALAVAEDATVHLWLLDPDEPLSPDAEHGCGRACCAPHEQSGHVSYRCVAVARSQEQCRSRTREPGGMCAMHREHPPDNVATSPVLLADRRGRL